MINLKELPLIFLLSFTLVYSTIGDPNSAIWSGLYFVANYATLLLLFHSYKSKLIRKIGIALSSTILIFVVLKFFAGFDYIRVCNFVVFGICLLSLTYIDRKCTK